MYLKDLLNNKELKINIRHNHELSVEVYTYTYDGIRLSSLYYGIVHLYDVLYFDKCLILHQSNETIRINFSFNERKLDISFKTRLKYNISRL